MKHSWLSETLFAHRGLHGLKPGIVENSRAAFLEAIRHGYGIELDVQPTSDGSAVVFHDNSLERLTSAEGQVVAHTAEQLAKISLTGSKDKIETLDRILKTIAGRVPVLIEVKGNSGRHKDLCSAVARSLKAYQGPAAVISFRVAILKWFDRNLPDVPLGFVSKNYDAATGLPVKKRRALSDLTALGTLKPEFITYGIKSLPATAVENARAAGVVINCWTVRSRAERAIAAAHADTMTFEGFLA